MMIVLLAAWMAVAVFASAAPHAASQSLTVVSTAPNVDAVKNLTASTFDLTIGDPSNELWLLAFHSPGCPHCQKLLPILEDLAPQVEDKMSLAKIDCFAESDLCKHHGIAEVPTLMYARGGKVVGDYYGRRDSDSIVAFANKMNGDAIVEISNSLDVEELSASSGYGVAFLAYDPLASGSTLDEVLKSTKMLSAFHEVAKKNQAHSSFGVIMPDAIKDEVIQFPSGKEEPTIAKLEENIAPKLFQGRPSKSKLTKFVRENHLPTVVPLGPHNFHDVGNQEDKRMAILFVDPDEHSSSIAELKQYAVYGPSNVTRQFVFSWIDATLPETAAFLYHFSISKRSLPELVVYDAHTGKTWNVNESISTVEDFLEGVATGTIRPLGSSEDAPGPREFYTLDLFGYIVEVPALPAVSLVVLLLAVAVWFAPMPAGYAEAIDSLAEQTKQGKDLMDILVGRLGNAQEDEKKKERRTKNGKNKKKTE